MFDTPWLKFFVIFCWRSSAGHKAHEDGCLDLTCIHSASVRTVSTMHPSTSSVPEHLFHTINSTYTGTNVLVYLNFIAFEVSEFVCMFIGAWHCIAPPLNLEFQSMLKLDTKRARNSDRWCVFLRDVSWEFRCSFHNIEGIDQASIWSLQTSMMLCIYGCRKDGFYIKSMW